MPSAHNAMIRAADHSGIVSGIVSGGGLGKVTIGKATITFKAGDQEDFPLSVPFNNFHAVDFS